MAPMSTEPSSDPTVVAYMDQVMALARDAAQGHVDAAQEAGEPIVDPYMLALGCDMIRESEHDPEELITLLAATTLLLAQTMEERDGLHADHNRVSQLYAVKLDQDRQRPGKPDDPEEIRRRLDMVGQAIAERDVALVEVERLRDLLDQQSTEQFHARVVLRKEADHLSEQLSVALLAKRDLLRRHDQAAICGLPEQLRGDGPCGDCGTRDNIVWFTESVLWNEVVRSREPDGDPLMCIACFVRRADEAGLFPTGWRLLPDWHWETHAERDARRASAAPAESSAPTEPPSVMSDADEAALLARQRDEVLARCADREAHGATLIRLDEVVGAFVADPAAPVSGGTDEQS